MSKGVRDMSLYMLIRGSQIILIPPPLNPKPFRGIEGKNILMSKAEFPEINFDKISKTIHKKYIRLTSMLQGFQKYVA